MAKRSAPGKVLPFDTRGGVVRYSIHMLSSEQYLRLSAQAKVLVMLLQIHWRPDRPVGYGVREAAEKIPCAFNTARKAFNELEEAGFIVMVDTSLFLSRTGSKARTWRLTWMPYGPVPNTKPPTNEWERKGFRKISTDSNMNAVAAPEYADSSH